MPSSPNDRKIRRLLRANDEQVHHVVEELDATGRDRAVSRRSHRRFQYRHPECSVRIRQPGDFEAKWFTVATRNLSAGGAAVLHGGFVHPGSEVMMQLMTIQNRIVEVHGEVRSCRYVRTGVYEVCIRFATMIHPETFCREAQACRVLLIEPDPLVAELAQRQMQALHAVVSTVATPDLAMRRLRDERFDCVLLNGDIGVEQVVEGVQALQGAGHFGRIVTILSSRCDKQIAALEAAGCDRVLIGPLNSKLVSDLLEWLPGEPVVSSFSGDPMVRDLLLSFVESLAERVRTMHSLLKEGKSEELLQVVRTLRSSATGFGYEPLADEASRFEAVVAGGADAGPMQTALRSLILVIGNVRPPEETRCDAA